MRWRIESRFFILDFMFKHIGLSWFYETGVRLQFQRNPSQVEGIPLFLCHWEEVVRTSQQAVEEGKPIRVIP